MIAPVGAAQDAACSKPKRPYAQPSPACKCSRAGASCLCSSVGSSQLKDVTTPSSGGSCCCVGSSKLEHATVLSSCACLGAQRVWLEAGGLLVVPRALRLWLLLDADADQDSAPADHQSEESVQRQPFQAPPVQTVLLGCHSSVVHSTSHQVSVCQASSSQVSLAHVSSGAEGTVPSSAHPSSTPNCMSSLAQASSDGSTSPTSAWHFWLGWLSPWLGWPSPELPLVAREPPSSSL